MDNYLTIETLLEAVQVDSNSQCVSLTYEILIQKGNDQYRNAGFVPTLDTTTVAPSEVPTQPSTEFEVNTITPLVTTVTQMPTSRPGNQQALYYII